MQGATLTSSVPSPMPANALRRCADAHRANFGIQHRHCEEYELRDCHGHTRGYLWRTRVDIQSPKRVLVSDWAKTQWANPKSDHIVLLNAFFEYLRVHNLEAKKEVEVSTEQFCWCLHLNRVTLTYSRSLWIRHR
jgi:hypothetical protein